MATFRESALNRLLLSVLTRWRGEVAAIQAVRRVREVFRFAAVFMVTILLPALLLAYFALASIRSEELALDADLRTRAAAIEGQVQSELAGMVASFEEQTRRRVDAGGSLHEQVRELSPYLRVVIRVDREGQVVAPFRPPEAPITLPDHRSFRVPWRLGIQAEREARWSDASEAYQRAFEGATDDNQRALAAFARARARSALGEDTDALYADVYADYANARDRAGFRIGDLVLLARAEARLALDPEVGSSALQELVAELLDRRWALAGAGEPAIVRRALDALPASVDDEWLRRTRTRLNERALQLSWAEGVVTEIELLSTSVRPTAGEFRYIAGPDSRTFWGITQIDNAPVLFAFDLPALLDDLNAVAARSSDPDDALAARLTLSSDTDGSGFVRKTLGPYLQFVTLAIDPADPAALEGLKSTRRRMRVSVILLSVFLVAFGVLLSARIVGGEIENARMKADFAANVSHELRSPITQIRLKAESLQLDLCYDDDDRQEHYDAIVREAERLSRLVDNVLDFAAIERGAKRYSFRYDDLLEVLAIQLEGVEGTINGMGLVVEQNLPTDLPALWMDRDALGQVIVNLLSNAAKYGQEGKWIGITIEEHLETVELSVADRGIGISADELPHVFDDFFRSTDPKVRRIKGTGIGLAIVRYIVEAHGGTIAVTSEEGAGTTFTLTFPIPREESDAPNPVR